MPPALPPLKIEPSIEWLPDGNSKLNLPVNKIYAPYLYNESRYLHLWGGSGSGKSVFAAQKALVRITSEEGHRILCVRKVAQTLRSSVYQLLVDQIREMQLGRKFTINKTEMRFMHSGGGELLLAGLDDVEKLKSITGISSIWIEEATELSPADFDQLDLRLRGPTGAYKQIVFTYNPIDESHWLKARFHDKPTKNVTTLRTTFLDNKFIDEEYKTVLEQKAHVNPNLYRIYYMGDWGKEEVQRPYVYNFNPGKTISEKAVYRPELPIYFSIDFNVEPLICICAHIWKNGQGIHYHIFKEMVIEKNGDIYRMLDMLESTFGLYAMANCFFTGDAMQRKREVSQRDNIDAWRIIDTRLQLGRRLMLPRANPPVRENRHLVNAICAFHPDLKINPACKKLVYDLQYVEANADGDIIKQNRAKEQQRADALDTFRYQCNTHLRDIIEQIKR